MRSLLAFTITFPLLVLVACNESREGSQPSSGIEGLVLIGPQCPVAQPSSPCPDQPLQAVIEIYTPDGATKIGSVSSGPDGRFAIALEPGDYLLVPLPPDPDRSFPSAGEQPVIVRPDRWREVAITYDTGIR